MSPKREREEDRQHVCVCERENVRETENEQGQKELSPNGRGGEKREGASEECMFQWGQLLLYINVYHHGQR